MASTAIDGEWTVTDRWEATQVLYGQKVRTFARNSYRQIPDHEQCDVEQELLLVLWDCVIHYDPNMGASFNTYFQRSAKNRIITLIRHYETKSRSAPTVSLGDDAVATAVDGYLSVASAEEVGLMRLQITEYVTRYGEDVLSGDFSRELRKLNLKVA